MKGAALGIAVAVLALVLSGVTAGAETLTEALVATYAQNPNLRAKRAELRSIDESLPQALAGWRPTASLSASGGKQSLDPSTGKNRPLTPMSTQLTVVQPLYRGGRTVSGTLQADARVRAARADLKATEQNVLAAAVGAYMDVYRDQAVLELNRNNVQVLARQLEATRDRFEVGEITRTDVAQSEARLSRAVAERVRSEGNLAASRAAFTRVVGREATALEPPEVLIGLPQTRIAAATMAEDQNPTLLAARHAEAAARHGIANSKGSLWPSVSLVGDLSRSKEASLRSVRSESAFLGIEIDVPLYQAGAAYSSLRQRRQIASQRRLEIDGARRQVIQNATQAWEALNTAHAQIEARSKEVQAAEIALEGVKQEAEVGARTTLDVLDAEQELLDARVGLVVAERNETVTSFDLLSAIGGLTARKLALSVETYDPESHYRTVRYLWWSRTGDE
ncbi:MAG: TolC family outer membrane protein [Alphaproteobacteria bacterium]|nr:TolC family outer membrane protein [Alphaproteobacteria bacterium]